MGKVYYNLFYHAVWSTYCREPIIIPQVEIVLPPIFNAIAGKFNLFIHAEGGMEDHVHLILTIPPSITVSEAIGKLKGSSSHSLNHESGVVSGFSWQDGFGVRSFSERELPKMIRYVQNQRKHHGSGRVFQELEVDAGSEQHAGRGEM